MAPIIYTPTVGWVCQNFSKIFRRPRGMFFSSQDRGEMASMVYNWAENDVQAIVVTDGSRVLGLGDLGVGGLAISIGKLDLYVAAGGFDPQKVLPVVIDVGTNNQKLIKDPYYLGIKQKRLEGEEYYSLVDEFMSAVYMRWPNVLLQFEDFQLKHAVSLLRRYRKQNRLVFNDDIQGTACTILAAIFGALYCQKKSVRELINLRITIVGAGSAGQGAMLQVAQAMQKQGLNQQESAKRFWIIDDKGLITKARSKEALHQLGGDKLQYFARDEAENEGKSILDVIKVAKPHILIGLSGQGGIFTEDILKEMNNIEDRPIIFALSNPTSRSECTAEQAYKATNGRAIYASGSPFDDVQYNGQILSPSQCNNRYIFPGLAAGAYIGQTGIISDGMLLRCAEALAELLTPQEIRDTKLFPQIGVREISAYLAARVMEQAENEGRLSNQEAKKIYKQEGIYGLKAYVERRQWEPNYSHLVYLPEGVE